jgi:hypothetical protein
MGYDTTHTLTCLATMMKKREGSHALRLILEQQHRGRPSHLTLCHDKGRVATLPRTITGVGYPLLLPLINTRG